MRKIIASLLLGAIIFAGSLSSCSPAKDAVSDDITSTSSDSAVYGEWLEDDTDRIAVLSERYDRCMEMVREIGFDPANLPTIGNDQGCIVSYAPTLEEAAWSDWTEWYQDITGQPLPQNT